MQRNDNLFVALRQTYSVPYILRDFQNWVKIEPEAQRYFEQKESSTASRPLSQHSTLTGLSSNTISSSNALPTNVPASKDEISHPKSNGPAYNEPSSSQASVKPARYLGEWNTTLFVNRGPKQPPKPSRRPSSRGEPPVNAQPECPFCAEIGFTPSFKRTQDVRKHLGRFHKDNVVWICPRQDCGLAFDRDKRFEQHFKQNHSRVPADLPDAHVELHPQLVFPCGFEMCRYILEAKDEQDATERIGQYHDHIVNHLSENPQEKWSYERCLKNLMHQEGLKIHWRERKKGQEGRWQPQIHTSFVLRKIIETRRWRDPVRLVELVEAVGCPPHNDPGSACFPLPPGLSYPLEVGFSEDMSNDATDDTLDAPHSQSVDHPVSPRNNPMDHDQSSIHSQMTSPPYGPVSQDAETSAPQSYNTNPTWSHYPQYDNTVDPARPEGDMFGSYRANLFPANNAAHQLSQYPSGPLESHQRGSSGLYAPGYPDNGVVDPRLLTLQPLFNC
ncbi:hypothetical protein V8F20_003843 [Naviculisporaceae sp. PSN 640]